MYIHIHKIYKKVLKTEIKSVLIKVKSSQVREKRIVFWYIQKN